MSKTLFNDFSTVSSKEWKQKIQVDLKGDDYNNTLIWQSPEGIDVKPFYHDDEFSVKPETTNTKATKWQVCQDVYVASVTQANTKALNILNRGADSIKFILPTERVSVYHLLKNIKLKDITVYVDMQFLSEAFIIRLKNYLCHKNATVYLQIDLLGNLSKSGNWYRNQEEDHKILEKITKHYEAFKGILSIDMSAYQNAGANSVQQLAYGLAHANEYLNQHQEQLASGNWSDQQFCFNVSVGTNYFFEIAKIRALRVLWNTLAQQYKGTNPDCIIIAKPTKRNKTIYDYNTNMLRTTTECMSAILGGANAISNLPYDSLYHKDNEFAERIARNQLLILKNESYFNSVNNPADGAYYIESLTQQLAEKALILFKNIEANSGFFKQLKEGTIQRKIKESAKKEQDQFNEGSSVLIGTNKYQNENDTMKNDLELFPFVKINKRKTIIEPIISKRLAEELEQQRLKTEE